MIKLHCHDCGKFMAEVRDAAIRSGMVVLCAKCNDQRKTDRPLYGTKTERRVYDVPDFLQDLFGGKL